VDESTVAKLVEQMAAQNIAVNDLLAKLSSQVQNAAVTTQVEQEETGFGERYQTEGVDRSGVIFANVKRTYDEYQQESLESIKRNRSIVDKIVSDAQQFDNQRQNIATQALQNAVETANMVGKQAVRHSDIAIDRQWNVDEQGYTAEEILGNQTFKEGIRAAVVAAVAEALLDKKVTK
jgi:hypothetical protein